jgi:predicted O-linked N-acetylglucosamine transferase (SPINDLY family)
MAETDLQRALQTALEHHQGGRLAQAEALYRRVLAAFPDHTDALHLLGVLAAQTGHADKAVELIGRAIAINPNVAHYHSNLGEAYRKLGAPDAALVSLRRALELNPGTADAHVNLGLVLWELKRSAEAIAALRRAIQLQPAHAEACSALGKLLQDENQHEEAIIAFTHLLRLRPRDASAHNNLGVSLHAAGRIEDAAGAFRQAIQLQPGHARAHGNLGIALKESGRPEEAIAAYRRALELDPNLVRTHVNLGALLLDLGQAEAALASLDRAIELQGDMSEAHFNLGIALYRSNQLDDAIDAYQRAVQLQPDHADAYCGLGVATLVTGQAEKAIGHFRRALELQPDHVMAHSNLLMCAQYCPGVGLASLARAHGEWDRRHAAGMLTAVRPWTGDRDPDRMLRLGFVSADLRTHPVGLFLVPVLEHLDPHSCEVVCYHNSADHDHVTHRLAAAANRWHDVIRLTDDALADLIRDDRIDVLFDLSGHTEGNRLLVFARRPAPVQIAWLGYPGTTGLAAMDYLIADAYHVPSQAELHYREAILRMPESSVCFDPPAEAPGVDPLPALTRGYSTFGSFNSLAKLTPDVIGIWAEILHRVPDSRLLLGSRGLGGDCTQGRIRQAFAAAGVDPSRVELHGKIARRDLLAAYNTMDVALDPFPYSGGMTTCEALWMGVPVITLPGETMAGRHSLAHLSNVGLTQTIAIDRDDYIERAVRLAQDWPDLAALRMRLRDQVRRSPLCDGERFARDFVRLLRGAWGQWCRQ